MFTIFQNLVASIKHQPCNKRYVFNSLALKANSCYDYIQDNCFLGRQSQQKMFLCKMFLHGNNNGCDLVK